MRARHLSEMLRDSRAGSIVVAKLIAMALGGLLDELSYLVAAMVGESINWILRQARHDLFPVVSPIPIIWQQIVLSGISCAFLLGTGYLIAAWVYQPQKHNIRQRQT